MNKNILIAILVLILCNVAYAQQEEIQVKLPEIIPPSPSVASLMRFEELPINNYTGLPDISIPLYSENLGGVNLNITLKYHPAGTKVRDLSSDVGLGWSLSAGGAISRTVRGCPDELLTADRVGVYMSDPLTTNNYYKAVSNPVLNSNPDYRDFIFNTDAKGRFDTHHDLWQFNFLNYSGRFIVEKVSNALVVKMLDITPLKITPIISPSYPNVILGFDVFDEYGNNYVFDVVESALHSTLSTTIDQGNEITSNVSDNYNFTSSFHLSEIKDNNNIKLAEFDYTSVFEEITSHSTVTHISQSTTFADEITNVLNGNILICYGRSMLSVVYPTLSTNVSSIDKYSSRKLLQISTLKSEINFNYDVGREDYRYVNATNALVFKGLTVNNHIDTGLVKKFLVERVYRDAPTKKMFLSKIQQESSDNELLDLYTFEYKGQSISNFPMEDSWGYLRDYDPFFNSKEVDPVNVDAHTLQRIKTPTGGTVYLEYEPNTYSYVMDEELLDFSENTDNYDVTSSSVSITALNTHFNLFNLPSGADSVTITIDNNTNINEWYIGLYKDNVLQSTFTPFIHCTNGQCRVEFPDGLLAGNYTVKATTVEMGSNNIGVSNAINVNYSYRVTKPLNQHKQFLYGGGFRIKHMATFNNLVGSFIDFNTAETLKTYTYDFPGTEKSSGSLSSPRPYFSYDVLKVRPLLEHCSNISGVTMVFQETEHIYTVTHDSDVSGRNLTKGAAIGYKNVCVTQRDDIKSCYEYTSPIDYPDTILASAPLIDRPSLNYDYKRGLVTKETHFEGTNKVKETLFDYAFEDYQQLIGIKLYGTFDGGYSSNPSYKLFDDYNQFVSLRNTYISTGDYYIWIGDPTNFFLGALQISHDLHYDTYGWAKLMSKSTKDYFYEGSNQNIVETGEVFEYNPTNRKIAMHQMENSLGEDLRTNYYYDNNHANRNRIGVIKKIETLNDNDPIEIRDINYVNTFSGNTAYLPETIFVKKGANNAEVRLRYNKYDENSNPLEVRQENGTITSYIYGYHNTLPVAKLDNITYNQIPSALITAIKNATDASSYNEQAVINALIALRASTNADMIKAMISTYTYNPLVGITSMTDAKGYIMYYEYDEFNRLKQVKDAEGNILSKNDYNYATQN